MDHLIVPKYASVDRVPFLGLHYDNVDTFLNYQKWPPLANNEVLDNFLAKVQLSAHSTADIVSLAEKIHVAEEKLQAWLFFGLLKEFLGPTYDEKEFIATSNESMVLSSATLVEKVDKWISERVSGAVTLEELMKLDACIVVVYYTLAAFWHKDYNTQGKLCIASVAEMLHAAILKVAPEGSRFRSLGWILLWDADTVIDQLTKAGWCRYEASQVPRRAMFLSTLFFCSLLVRHNSGRDHRICTQAECNASTIQVTWQRKYGTPHREPNCGCHDVKISDETQERINDILWQDLCPVFRVKRGEDGLSIDVNNSTDVETFVAISHVFADGLGNEDLNAMKRCQLLHIQDLVTSFLTRDIGQDTHGDAWFWIDTFGCPRKDRKARNRAIKLLRNTFTTASHVLVLDSELQRLQSTIDELEMAARYLHSGWMHRIWALPEGTLPKSVWVQLEDRAVKVPDFLLDRVETLFNTCGIRYHLARDMILRLQALRGLGVQFQGPAPQLWLICAAMEFRLTWRPSDEPLCIGMIADLDLEALEKVDDEIERKRLFWRLLPYESIPRNIVFHKAPVLPLNGFHWAPKSLSATGLWSVLGPASHDNVSALHTDKPAGLRVRFPGAPMLLNCRESYHIDSLKYLQGPTPNNFPVLLSASGTWLTISKCDRSVEDETLFNLLLQQRRGKFAIIRSPEKGSLGLLLRIIDRAHGMHVVERVFNIHIANESAENNGLLQRLVQKAEIISSRGEIRMALARLSVISANNQSEPDVENSYVTLDSAYAILDNALEAATLEVFAEHGEEFPSKTQIYEVLSRLFAGFYGEIYADSTDGLLPELACAEIGLGGYRDSKSTRQNLYNIVRKSWLQVPGHVREKNQLSDALATLYHALSELRGQQPVTAIETFHKVTLSPRHGYW